MSMTVDVIFVKANKILNVKRDKCGGYLPCFAAFLQKSEKKFKAFPVK